MHSKCFLLKIWIFRGLVSFDGEKCWIGNEKISPFFFVQFGWNDRLSVVIHTLCDLIVFLHSWNFIRLRKTHWRQWNQNETCANFVSKWKFNLKWSISMSLLERLRRRWMWKIMVWMDEWMNELLLNGIVRIIIKLMGRLARVCVCMRACENDIEIWCLSFCVQYDKLENGLFSSYDYVSMLPEFVLFLFFLLGFRDYIMSIWVCVCVFVYFSPFISNADNAKGCCKTTRKHHNG